MSVIVRETERSLVCVFEKAVDKHRIMIDPIRQELAPNDPPDVVQIPDPNAPLLFSFRNVGLEIIYMGNRLRIQSSASEGTSEADGFSAIASKVLRNSGVQHLRAFGFNFDFELKLKSVSELFGLRSATQSLPSFDYVGEPFVRLSYTRDGGKYTVDFTEVGQGSKSHVNVHHAGNLTTGILGETIEDIHKDDRAAARRLIEEVAGSASRDE